MRYALVGTLVVLCAVTPCVSRAGTSVGVGIGIENGPTTIRLSFRSAPRVVHVRECDVDVVEDERCPDDVFRYAGTWWVVRDDHWYRAADWRGPFVRVRDRAVPVALWRVPEPRWKHHPHGMPPGLARRRGDLIAHEHGRDRDRGREHEHADARDRGHDEGRGH